jgi:hypothetical protein
MTTLENRLKVVEEVEYKGDFTAEEFAQYRAMFMVCGFSLSEKACCYSYPAPEI